MSKANALGIAIDSYGQRRFRRKNREVDVVLGDARKVPLKGEIFDAVFMIRVSDYIPELELAFSESYNMLGRGGYLVVSFGNKSILKSRFREKPYQHSARRARRFDHGCSLYQVCVSWRGAINVDITAFRDID